LAIGQLATKISIFLSFKTLNSGYNLTFINTFIFFLESDMGMDIFLKEQWKAGQKHLKEHTEIICSEEIHGMMFNMRGIFFDKLACEQMLQADINTHPHAKRELVHALYLAHFIDSMAMQGKHFYGNCDVSIDNEMVEVKNYQAAILSQITGQLEVAAFGKYIGIIENVLNLYLDEKLEAREKVVRPMLVELALPDDLSLYFPNLQQEQEELALQQAKRNTSGLKN
jgi:hypothetical protein